MIMYNYLVQQIKKSIDIKNKLLENREILDEIVQISNVCINAYKNNKKILIAGNGGSAADAQHIAGELVNKFYFDRAGLAAFALTTDTSILTAIGNDYGYEKLFSRQIQANGDKGDVSVIRANAASPALSK